MDALPAALNELQTFPIFSGFKKEELLYLCEGGRIIVTEHGDSIFCAGDSAHSIKG